jgi:anthranilate 1,2-dioxygenase large subunit
MSVTEIRNTPIEELIWPAEGVNRIPAWVYTSEEVYKREVERIFHGATWNYVGLDAEIPKPGDFRRSHVGPTAVIVARDADGSVHVFQNRCAHRGAEFCRLSYGNTNAFICPYHQWTYNLRGELKGIPFRRGLNGKGGMPAGFEPSAHPLTPLKVQSLNGVIFASFNQEMDTVEEYLGPENLETFKAIFNGRPIEVLGHHRNRMTGNWKLYPENIKDTYHGSLLHAFLVTFGLHRADSETVMVVDKVGRHGFLGARRSSLSATTKTKEVDTLHAPLKLADARIVELKSEFDSPWTVTMQAVWPGLITQRQSNTLGVRQIVPKGPNEFDLYWTMFGYADDTPEMKVHRIRQGNLMGPAGFIGLEDGEVLEYVQDGMRQRSDRPVVIDLGGNDTGTVNHAVSEAAIRGMYKHYREVMGF